MKPLLTAPKTDPFHVDSLSIEQFLALCGASEANDVTVDDDYPLNSPKGRVVVGGL
jgi:hypothetical protein